MSKIRPHQFDDGQRALAPMEVAELECLTMKSTRTIRFIHVRFGTTGEALKIQTEYQGSVFFSIIPIKAFRTLRLALDKIEGKVK